MFLFLAGFVCGGAVAACFVLWLGSLCDERNKE